MTAVTSPSSLPPFPGRSTRGRLHPTSHPQLLHRKVSPASFPFTFLPEASLEQKGRNVTCQKGKLPHHCRRRPAGAPQMPPERGCRVLSCFNPSVKPYLGLARNKNLRSFNSLSWERRPGSEVTHLERVSTNLHCLPAHQKHFASNCLLLAASGQCGASCQGRTSSLITRSL